MSKSSVVLALTVKEVRIAPTEVIPVDATILVDVDKMIGLHGARHFDIFPDEYIIVT